MSAFALFSALLAAFTALCALTTAGAMGDEDLVNALAQYLDLEPVGRLGPVSSVRCRTYTPGLST